MGHPRKTRASSKPSPSQRYARSARKIKRSKKESKKTRGTLKQDHWPTVVRALVEMAGGKRQLGDLLDVSDATVHGWLRGTSPKGTQLALAVARMGVDPAWLLTGTGEAKPNKPVDDPRTKESLRTARTELLHGVEHLGLTVIAIREVLGQSDRRDIEAALEHLLQAFRGGQ